MIVSSALCWASCVTVSLGCGDLLTEAAPMISTMTNDVPNASSGVTRRQRSRLISPLSAHGSDRFSLHQGLVRSWASCRGTGAGLVQYDFMALTSRSAVALGFGPQQDPAEQRNAGLDDEEQH